MYQLSISFIKGCMLTLLSVFIFYYMLPFVYEHPGISDQDVIKKALAGIFDIPAPSRERTEAIKAFDLTNPKPKCDNWIYVDYALVSEWAKNEPTEFLAIITEK